MSKENPQMSEKSIKSKGTLSSNPLKGESSDLSLLKIKPFSNSGSIASQVTAEDSSKFFRFKNENKISSKFSKDSSSLNYYKDDSCITSRHHSLSKFSSEGLTSHLRKRVFSSTKLKSVQINNSTTKIIDKSNEFLTENPNDFTFQVIDQNHSSGDTYFLSNFEQKFTGKNNLINTNNIDLGSVEEKRVNAPTIIVENEEFEHSYNSSAYESDSSSKSLLYLKSDNNQISDKITSTIFANSKINTIEKSANFEPNIFQSNLKNSLFNIKEELNTLSSEVKLSPNHLDNEYSQLRNNEVKIRDNYPNSIQANKINNEINIPRKDSSLSKFYPHDRDSLWVARRKEKELNISDSSSEDSAEGENIPRIDGRPIRPKDFLRYYFPQSLEDRAKQKLYKKRVKQELRSAPVNLKAPYISEEYFSIHHPSSSSNTAKLSEESIKGFILENNQFKIIKQLMENQKNPRSYQVKRSSNNEFFRVNQLGTLNLPNNIINSSPSFSNSTMRNRLNSEKAFINKVSSTGYSPYVSNFNSNLTNFNNNNNQYSHSINNTYNFNNNRTNNERIDNSFSIFNNNTSNSSQVSNFNCYSSKIQYQQVQGFNFNTRPNFQHSIPSFNVHNHNNINNINNAIIAKNTNTSTTRNIAMNDVKQFTSFKQINPKFSLSNFGNKNPPDGEIYTKNNSETIRKKKINKEVTELNTSSSRNSYPESKSNLVPFFNHTRPFRHLQAIHTRTYSSIQSLLFSGAAFLDNNQINEYVYLSNCDYLFVFNYLQNRKWKLISSPGSPLFLTNYNRLKAGFDYSNKISKVNHHSNVDYSLHGDLFRKSRWDTKEMKQGECNNNNESF